MTFLTKYTGSLFLGTVVGLLVSPASADIKQVVVKPFVANAECPKETKDKQ